MHHIGIDIGSTCAKCAVMDEEKNIKELFVIPTGWNSYRAIGEIEKTLSLKGIDLKESPCISTGYGREAVLSSQRKVTEISCHAMGASIIFSDKKINVIDVGGQDTKVISCTSGKVTEFYMNDKCAAGTGKFVEVMANRLNVPIGKMDEMARQVDEKIEISSLCTVFAESEVISLFGQGKRKEDIAWGVFNSVAKKVSQEYSKLKEKEDEIFLTGGLCESDFFIELLSLAIGSKVCTDKNARYAGAIGAAALSY